MSTASRDLLRVGVVIAIVEEAVCSIVRCTINLA